MENMKVISDEFHFTVGLTTLSYYNCRLPPIPLLAIVSYGGRTNVFLEHGLPNS